MSRSLSAPSCGQNACPFSILATRNAENASRQLAADDSTLFWVFSWRQDFPPHSPNPNSWSVSHLRLHVSHLRLGPIVFRTGGKMLRHSAVALFFFFVKPLRQLALASRKGRQGSTSLAQAKTPYPPSHALTARPTSSSVQGTSDLPRRGTLLSPHVSGVQCRPHRTKNETPVALVTRTAAAVRSEFASSTRSSRDKRSHLRTKWVA